LNDMVGVIFSNALFRSYVFRPFCSWTWIHLQNCTLTLWRATSLMLFGKSIHKFL
jgi:hypothetical protein